MAFSDLNQRCNDSTPEDLNDRPLCQARDQTCSSCGAPMYEVDRRQEDGMLYRWLECVDSACGNQWLDHQACW